MRGCVRASDAAALLGAVAALAASAGCGRRDLVVVDPCVAIDAGACKPDPGSPLLAGLVGWWTLDDGAGSAVARDRSGNDNHGTLTGLSASSAWVPGKNGTALELRGVGYADVAPSETVDGITSQVTLAAWVYFEGAVQDFATALSRTVGTSLQQHYHLSLNTEEKPSLFITTTKGAVLVRAPDAVARFTWVHLAGTYDGAYAQLFVDGRLVDMLPVTGSFAPETNSLVLGGNLNGTAGVTERFPGRIDELMLWRRALTAEEIQQLQVPAAP